MSARDPEGVRYEQQDVSPGAVARFGVILVAVTILTAAVLLPVFGWLKARQARLDAPPPPMGRLEPGRQPPEPRLQTTPAGDLASVQAQQRSLLSGYAWVDRKAGTVRIPVERAMEILVARQGKARPSIAASPGPGPSPTASPEAAGARP